jgi:hypothetical protein
MADNKIYPINLNFKELFSVTNPLRPNKNQRKKCNEGNLDVDKDVYVCYRAEGESLHVYHI